jgi:hypothetical protein
MLVAVDAVFIDQARLSAHRGESLRCLGTGSRGRHTGANSGREVENRAQWGVIA